MIKNNIINIAIPRGRILKELKFIFKKIKLIPEKSLFDDSCRKLSFDTNKRNIKVIKVRAFDVCTFVAFGAAQFGIAGSDVVDEFNYSEVYTPIDLNIGHCRLSVAALKTLEIMERDKSWKKITYLGKKLFLIWQKLSRKYNLTVDISGLPSLAKFNFKSKNAQAYKTFITQEMLDYKFLAANVVYLSIAHNEKILKKYSEHLDEIFYTISECEKGNLNISNILKYPVSHSKFGRLN